MACGTPLIPFSRTSFEIVASDRALPRALGNTRADSLLVWDSCKISQARDDNGTRCSFPVFVRAAGMIQVRFLRSTSSHVIKRASPLRVAVKTKKLKATDSRWIRLARPDGFNGRPNLFMGNGLEMALEVVGFEGGLQTISPIACVDVGFGTRFVGLSHRMSHRKRPMRPALAIAGFHGCGVATGLRTSSQRAFWCGRLAC